jgi:hypothetical protein
MSDEAIAQEVSRIPSPEPDYDLVQKLRGAILSVHMASFDALPEETRKVGKEVGYVLIERNGELVQI